ncbi:MAG: SDR family oxidoreductase [Saprospiraceae bacterium]|nr:SDR family oxidoreductase [Saprospiraceae bacterium]MBK8371860.1 SDR family oxidoreductase [Saprospiraceae bacterium]
MNPKIVLITGGTKGIGFGIAEVMLANNHKVIITGREKDRVEKAVSELTSKYKNENVIGFECDVTDLSGTQNVIHEVNKRWGYIDIVIANAGVGHFGSIEELTAEQWNETIQVNLTGVFNTVKATLEDLKKTKGYLITIASLAGTNFFAGGSAYNASKFGLVGFTQAVMLDIRKYGIKVTTIMPGSVTSHFNNHMPVPEDEWKIQPEDIGQMVNDLINMHPRTLPSKIEIRPTQPK